MAQIDVVLAAAERRNPVKRVGKEYRTNCPAHADEHPSLDFRENSGGTVVVHCRSQRCGVADIMRGFGLEVRDLFPPGLRAGARFVNSPVQATDFASYVHDRGLREATLKYFNIKSEGNGLTFPLGNGLPSKTRNFGNGSKFLNPKGQPIRLYHFAPCKEAETVYFLEGEPDVWTGHQAGLKCFCATGGAGINATVRQLPASVGKGDVTTLYGNLGFDDAEFVAAVEALPEADSASPLVEQTLVDVEPETVEWLWPGRIPLGKLTILDGEPGLGKSTIALDLAARVSTNGLMPDGTRGPVSDVLILSVEDGLADTIVPRLIAAGADMSRIHALSKQLEDGSPDLLTIPDDVELIRGSIERHHAKLVVLDPLIAFIGENFNTWSDHHIRRALTPVAQMADDVGAAVIGIRHPKKASDTAINRGGGSIGIIALARSGLILGRDPNDDSVRILASTKSNLAPTPKSLRYTIAGASNGSCGIEWEGVTDLSAEDIGPRQQVEKGPVDEAVEFLKAELRDGAQPSGKVNSDAKGLGIAERTLYRARKTLRVEARKETIGNGKWMLQLPAD